MTERGPGRDRRRAVPGRHRAVPGRPWRARAERSSRSPWHGRRARRPEGADAARPSAAEQSGEPSRPSPGEPSSAERSPDAAAHAASPQGPRHTDPEQRHRRGSLSIPVLWTALSSVVPGSGLIPSPLRRIGLVLMAILVLTGVTAASWYLLGDPLTTVVAVATSRPLLLGLTGLVALAGIAWLLQIIATNLTHNTRQRLQSPKKWVSLALALVMVVAVALPFGRGVQSLWAAQGLLTNQTVFGGVSDDRLDRAEPWADVDRLNVLLLGLDEGDDRTGTRPDTIMVASIDTETGRTALFSIPRNLQNVEFPEGTAAAEVFPDGFDAFGPDQNLINAVWTWAEDRPELFPGDPNPGLTATTQAVEETLGLETSYYAIVNLQGFEDMVDAIGGVRLEVERRIPIGGGGSEVTGYIESGWQNLDGYEALWYARSREGADDFDRMCRQQRIVRAVTEELDPPTVAMAFPRLVTATEQNIVTNIPSGQLDAFAQLGLQVREGGFTSYPITNDVTSTADPDFEYLESWVDASIEDSMQREDPDSVVGGAGNDATTPAQDETGQPAAPGATEEETTAPGEEPTETTPPTEEPTETTSPTAEETTDGGTGPDGSEQQPTAENPQIEQDPLASCMP